MFTRWGLVPMDYSLQNHRQDHPDDVLPIPHDYRPLRDWWHAGVWPVSLVFIGTNDPSRGCLENSLCARKWSENVGEFFELFA